MSIGARADRSLRPTAKATLSMPTIVIQLVIASSQTSNPI
jgi:hypothetical protein